MKTVTLEMPDELVELTGSRPENLSKDSLKILVLELFREEAISLGKAAELCNISIEEFMTFAASRRVPIHYTQQDLEDDRSQMRQVFP